jgi:hypothetical protein
LEKVQDMRVSFATLNPDTVNILPGVQQNFDGMHPRTNIRVGLGWPGTTAETSP